MIKPEYITSFITGAKRYHNLVIDYVGIWNETPYNTQWIKTLSKELKRNSLSAKIVAADEVCSWNIAEDMKNGPELKNAIDIVGTHYPDGSTTTAQNCGKTLWASEEGATMRNHWDGAKHLIRKFNQGYIKGKMVKQVIWSLVGSYYDILPVPESGLLNACTPWNGDFQTKPVTWTVAHYTQFVQPGWVYLEGANGFLNKDKSSYVTLYNPKSADYSMIFETVDYDKDQEIEVVVDKKLKQSKVYVWKTDIDASFVKVATITPKNGRFSLKLLKGSIYSLTTTTGQRKADDKPTTLSNKAFPFPYSDDFESYNLGSQPRYMSDQAGVFEVVNKPNRGKVLQQTINQRGIEWLYHVNPDPHTFVGDTAWRNYTVEVDVKLNTPSEHATIFGRLNGMYQHSTTEPNSYWLKVDGQGNWTLGKTLKAIQNGHYNFKSDWPEFYARFNNTNQSLQLSYNELMALPAADLAKFGKVAELIKADTDPEMLFVECLQWGMFDLRRRTELAKGQIPIDTNQWQNLKLSFHGKNISVEINNKSILTIRDTSYSNGMVGLGCGYEGVMFDNFKVK